MELIGLLKQKEKLRRKKKTILILLAEILVEILVMVILIIIMKEMMSIIILKIHMNMYLVPVLRIIKKFSFGTNIIVRDNHYLVLKKE
jgi:hypothetical protein